MSNIKSVHFLTKKNLYCVYEIGVLSCAQLFHQHSPHADLLLESTSLASTSEKESEHVKSAMFVKHVMFSYIPFLQVSWVKPTASLVYLFSSQNTVYIRFSQVLWVLSFIMPLKYGSIDKNQGTIYPFYELCLQHHLGVIYTIFETVRRLWCNCQLCQLQEGLSEDERPSRTQVLCAAPWNLHDIWLHSLMSHLHGEHQSPDLLTPCHVYNKTY